MDNSPDRALRSAFVLASVAGHAMIVNRFDYDGDEKQGCGAGVGASLLETGSHEAGEIGLIGELADIKRQHNGPGVILIDGGANIGTHTVSWARHMMGWGSVMAFEPQERVFYALCGNVALNNCFNAAAAMVALGAKAGRIQVPRLNPQSLANFGGLSLKPELNKQKAGAGTSVPVATIDDLRLPRLDILKLDLEGMEPDALDGARQTIARCRPIVFAEIATCGNVAVAHRLPGYECIACGMSVLAIHKDDPAMLRIQVVGDGGAITIKETA